MSRARILIVDDAVVVRRWLTEALPHAGPIDVAGSAPNGRIALQKIPQLRPDVVIFDTDMPESPGTPPLATIRRLYPDLPVIVLTEPTARGAAATIDALALGAREYVIKPDGNGRGGHPLQALSDELAARIGLCGTFDPLPRSGTFQQPAPPVARRRPVERREPARVDVLAIGVSTGGPEALMNLVPRLPAGFPIPILIVQHMPPVFTKMLAERLAAKSRIAVIEAGPAQLLSPGTACIAPGNFHMVVERDDDAVRVRTHQDPPENSCRPAADVLFRSVADVYGSHALAVVMTGMGQDGLRGSERIHLAGGQVLVQDEASSVVWGMPGFVAKAGLADRIVPLADMGLEIMDRVSRHRAARHTDNG